jgi:phytol kinase
VFQIQLPVLWVHTGLVGLWVALVFLTAEGLGRYTQVDREIIRKIVHIGSGNIILLAWWLQIPEWIGISASVLFSMITFLSYYLPILPGVNGVGRKSWGTFFYAISIGVLIAWFWPLQLQQYAAIGILIMTWGDGLAALVGQRLGTHLYQVAGIQKSWEGSATMAIVSFAVTGLILLVMAGNLWQVWAIATSVALSATLLETFSKFGVDNLTVPLGSAALSFFLTEHLFLQGF